MNRIIIDFHLDEEGDWVASLDCGHKQHVRHRPPLIERPWVMAEESRRKMIGKEWSCPLCDRLEIPEGFEVYSRTPEFDARSIPVKIRSHHETGTGIWGKITVLQGHLRYTVGEPIGREFMLDKTIRGIVSPHIPHKVEPIGDVRFFIEFYRSADHGKNSSRTE